MEFSALQDPNSQIVCLISWLFTIEPPFYHYISEACWKQDFDKMTQLGPFMCVLDKVLYWAEYRKVEKIMPGNEQLRTSNFGVSEEALLMKDKEDVLD